VTAVKNRSANSLEINGSSGISGESYLIDDFDRVADLLGQLLSRLNGHGTHRIHGPPHHLFLFGSPLHPRGRFIDAGPLRMNTGKRRGRGNNKSRGCG
jgi:hypothetical protein